MNAPAGTGIYFDGRSSRKRSVTLRHSLDLQLLEDGARVASWPYADIRLVDEDGGLRLRCITAEPLARLEVADSATAASIRARCPSLLEGRGSGSIWPIVGWSLGAVCSIVLIVLYGIPLLADRLAPLVPSAIERRIGDAVDRQVRAIFGGKVCAKSEGQAAFLKMVGKLVEAGGAAGPIEARVLSSRVPNAMALPGGKLYLFDGLLRRARNPDEIAGVMAHEIGHAERRDGMRALIRTSGTTYLFGLLFGDVMGGGAIIAGTQALLSASHSRQAESDADDFAGRAMAKLGRPPTSMGELLLRVTGTGRGSILDSHPVSSERLKKLRDLAPAVAGPPLLTDEEWKALTQICGDAGQ